MGAGRPWAPCWVPSISGRLLPSNSAAPLEPFNGTRVRGWTTCLRSSSFSAFVHFAARPRPASPPGRRCWNKLLNDTHKKNDFLLETFQTNSGDFLEWQMVALQRHKQAVLLAKVQDEEEEEEDGGSDSTTRTEEEEKN